MMKNRIISLLVLSMSVNLVGLSFANPASAEVERVSRDRYKDGPVRRWEAKVYCVGQEEPVIIKRLLSNRTWCAKEDDSICSLDKQELATTLCSDNPSGGSAATAGTDQAADNVQTSEPNPQSDPAPQSPPQVTESSTPVQLDDTANYSLVLKSMSRADLLQEQIRIDDALIRLQQSKLELRKREVELTRRLMAL